MKSFISLLFSVLYGIYAFAADVPAEILIGRVDERPPSYFQKNEEWFGSNIEAFQALSLESGIKIEYKVMSWSRAMHDMKDKHVIIAQLTPSKERGEFMYFIGPHDREQMVLAVQKKDYNYRIKNLDDLAAFSRIKGKKIAYQQGVIYSREFNDRIKTDEEFSKCFVKIVTYTTVLQMLEHGRIAGFLDVKSMVSYQLKHKYRNSGMVIHPFIISNTDVYFGVSKTISDVTLKKLQTANKKLQKNGTYQKITDKWSD